MLQFVCFILIGFILGCGGQGSGFAPSAPSTNIVTDNQSIFKYGQEVLSVNGWNIALDHTDPVETVSLANGWTVEVLHE